METFLPLVSAAIIPFIPNNVLRYVALTVAILAFVGNLVYRVAPGCQVAALERAVKNVEEMFKVAAEEYVGNPRFVYEAELKLVEVKHAVSTLHIRTIDVKTTPWNKYFQQLRNLSLSTTRWRREVEDLQSSIQLEIELTRKQRYEDDMKLKRATLDRMFVGGV